MNLISRIPKDFYKVFGSKYMEFYMQFLVAVYEESSQSYSLLGLTEGECQAIMNEQLARMVGESVTQIESYDNGWSKISLDVTMTKH